MRLTPNVRRHSRLGFLLAAVFLLVTGSHLHAQMGFLKKRNKPTAQQKSLDDYLARVKVLASEPHTTGSLWSPTSLLGVSASDYKARHVGDLLIVRVVDNFSATTNGSIQAQRTFNATSGIGSSLIGNAVTANALTNLFAPSSTQNLNGKGQSALSSTLSLNISGHVVDELPNGVLVVEAVRDLTVGNDRQTIVLHGLVRPLDIAQDNSISSSSIANLEAEVQGKGAVADSIHQPNVVIRTLLKIVGF
jgi:flagellar L-ring protein FlgH